MKPRNQLVALSSAILFAACSSDAVVSPMKIPTGPRLSVSTGSGIGSYIVLLKGNNADGFAENVAALGGKATYVNANAGFATVAGLPSAAVAQLSAMSVVADVEADQAVSLNSPVPSTADAALVGNPSVESQANPATAILAAWQWDMASIHAGAAWSAGKLGDPNVKVAILDTGIDYNSLDANGLVDASSSTSFMDLYIHNSTSHADSLLTPHQDTVRADNFVRATFFPSRAPYTDFNGHGTNVASTVSSKAFALAGVTSKTTLMAVKVLGSNGSGSLGTVLSGVLWAADHGADVANMSLGGGFGKSGNGQIVGIINKVFNYAKQQGMLIVVSAGNSAIDLQHDGNLYSNYCDAPHVLCVSAVGLPSITGNPDAPAFYSNFGRNSIGVAAPGGNATLDKKGNLVPSNGWPWGSPDIASWVWSLCAKDRLAGFTTTDVPLITACAAGNRLTGFIGTSQAAPHVTGLAALLVAQYGKGNPMMIKKIIQNTGDALDPDLNDAFGRTRINVQRALGL